MSKMRAEVKLLKNIEDAKGEWRVSHVGSWDGRRQSRAILKIDEKYYTGLAECSHKDNFNRKLGRVIALGRAWMAYKQNKPTGAEHIQNYLKVMW